MLKQRILSTLKFFDLQDYPLTLLELQEFLLGDFEEVKSQIDGQGEIIKDGMLSSAQTVKIDQLLNCLDTEARSDVKNTLGFYHLHGRENIVHARLNNYFYGIEREKLIKQYIRGLRHIPFVRGVALAGSQALGQQKPGSDIDLLIITHRRLLWLTRTLVTAYFQVIGKRRHGQYIANRFCLNHYVAGPKAIKEFKNFYTGAEYLKLRPLVLPEGVEEFQKSNQPWIAALYPNTNFSQPKRSLRSKFQQSIEKIFNGRLGIWLDQILKNWQLPKIRQEKFIVVEEDELSFHPNSKQQVLLEKFLHG